ARCAGHLQEQSTVRWQDATSRRLNWRCRSRCRKRGRETECAWGGPDYQKRPRSLCEPATKCRPIVDWLWLASMPRLYPRHLGAGQASAASPSAAAAESVMPSVMRLESWQNVRDAWNRNTMVSNNEPGIRYIAPCSP